MNNKDIFYTAGFFDGDGHTSIGYGGRPEVRFTNNNKEILEYLKKLWGGNIYKQKNSNAYYLVIVKREDVLKTIETIYPHLIVRKLQAERVIEITNFLKDLKNKK